MKAKLHLLIVTLFVAAIDAGLGQPILRFATNTCTVVENAASVTLTVRRLNDTNAAVTVDYATADNGSTAGLIHSHNALVQSGNLAHRIIASTQRDEPSPAPLS